MDWDQPSLDYKPKYCPFIKGVSSQSARSKDLHKLQLLTSQHYIYIGRPILFSRVA